MLLLFLPTVCSIPFLLLSLTVNKFDFGLGSDHTGVPTKFLRVNTSVEMIIYNPATFFGIHFSSSSVQLFYSEIAVASGQSEEIVKVKVEGNKVPLYGAGASLAAFDYRFYRVPLRLELDIRSRADVMGKLVRTKYRIRVSLFSGCGFQDRQSHSLQG
ncbi:hypothetical protein RHMOL_Rhmol01G0093300 [Rhododendron molle]|uniref:Uncharacterized protein n=1 Tax=Rhododendron molle TaxID=49168 RepID=A0ACC0Q2K7_RHOML|nr:hypothetical protein RHMOL_Rhmol01G0093300 [Rhododendron molle]